MRIYKRRSF